MTFREHPRRPILVTFETLFTSLTIESNNLNIHSYPWIKSDRYSIRNSCSMTRNILGTWVVCGLWDWVLYFSPLKERSLSKATKMFSISSSSWSDCQSSRSRRHIHISASSHMTQPTQLLLQCWSVHCDHHHNCHHHQCHCHHYHRHQHNHDAAYTTLASVLVSSRSEFVDHQSYQISFILIRWYCPYLSNEMVWQYAMLDMHYDDFADDKDDKDYVIDPRRLDWRGCYATPGLLASWSSCLSPIKYPTTYWMPNVDMPTICWKLEHLFVHCTWVKSTILAPFRQIQTSFKFHIFDKYLSLKLLKLYHLILFWRGLILFLGLP